MTDRTVPQWTADIEARDDTVIVHVEGEIDLSNAPLLEQCLIESIAMNKRLCVVDLAQVSFLDSSGLGVLVGHLERLRDHEPPPELRVVVKAPHVVKVFEVTGLDKVFSLYADVEAAASSRS